MRPDVAVQIATVLVRATLMLPAYRLHEASHSSQADQPEEDDQICPRSRLCSCSPL